MTMIDAGIAKIASALATEIAARVDEVHGRTEDWLNENFRRQIVDRHARDVIAGFLSDAPPPEILKQLGATGKYPRGRLGSGDEGELKMTMSHDSYGNVRLDFGKSVAWLALPPEIAINFAKLILRHCGVETQKHL